MTVVRCITCDRPLRAAASIARGYGPVCAPKKVRRAGAAAKASTSRASAANGLKRRPRRASQARSRWTQLEMFNNAAAIASGTNTNGQAGQGSPVVPAT